jgi:hypothetical protein
MCIQIKQRLVLQHEECRMEPLGNLYGLILTVIYEKYEILKTLYCDLQVTVLS